VQTSVYKLTDGLPASLEPFGITLGREQIDLPVRIEASRRNWHAR